MKTTGVGGGTPQIHQQLHQRRTAKKKKAGQTQSNQKTNQSGNAKAKQQALAKKAKNQKAKAAQASVTNKGAKGQHIQNQMRALDTSTVQGNSQQLDQSLNTLPASGSPTAQTLNALTQTPPAPAPAGDDEGGPLEKVIDVVGGLADTAEKIKETPDSRVSSAVMSLGATEDGLDSTKKYAETGGKVLTGIKATMTLKDMIAKRSLEGGVDLMADLAELSGYEDVKGVAALAKAASEIYAKTQKGEMDTQTALEQLTSVTEQLGSTLEAVAEGGCLAQTAVAASSIQAVAGWAGGFVPDMGLSAYVPDVTAYIPGADAVKSIAPGLASATAAYQLYCDGYEYMYGDKDGQPVKNAGSKALLSGIKLASSFTPAGKLMGAGCDFIRWGISA